MDIKELYPFALFQISLANVADITTPYLNMVAVRSIHLCDPDTSDTLFYTRYELLMEFIRKKYQTSQDPISNDTAFTMFRFFRLQFPAKTFRQRGWLEII